MDGSAGSLGWVGLIIGLRQVSCNEDNGVQLQCGCVEPVFGFRFDGFGTVPRNMVLLVAPPRR